MILVNTTRSEKMLLDSGLTEEEFVDVLSDWRKNGKPLLIFYPSLLNISSEILGEVFETRKKIKAQREERITWGANDEAGWMQLTIPDLMFFTAYDGLNMVREDRSQALAIQCLVLSWNRRSSVIDVLAVCNIWGMINDFGLTKASVQW